MLEIIVLKKYLIRGLDKCYAFSKVKDGKEAKIITKQELRKIDGVKQMANVSDYSNFGDESYPSSIANCFSDIIDEEVRCSNVKGDGLEAIIQIRDLVEETKESIDLIAKILSYKNK